MQTSIPTLWCPAVSTNHSPSHHTLGRPGFWKHKVTALWMLHNKLKYSLWDMITYEYLIASYFNMTFILVSIIIWSRLVLQCWPNSSSLQLYIPGPLAMKAQGKNDICFYWKTYCVSHTFYKISIVFYYFFSENNRPSKNFGVIGLNFNKAMASPRKVVVFKISI